MTDEALHAEVGKRLTLNWLIQGASQHVGLTLHHLVRDELTAIDAALPRLYDQFTLMGLLQYWRPVPTLIFGWPPRFWGRAGRDRSHPFFGHRLLAEHGGTLAEAGRRRALARGREKGVMRLPFTFTAQMAAILYRLRRRERRHHRALEEVARHATSLVWGIAPDRLDARLTPGDAIPPFAPIHPPRSAREALFLAGAVGWGGVTRGSDGELRVVATAVNGCLLAKELVKGTAELICLHGLGTLEDATYAQVMDRTDRLEFEPWMIQSGGELWRRLLAAIPAGRRPAEVLMHLSRLPPKSLESLMVAVIEQPDWARELLGTLAAPE